MAEPLFRRLALIGVGLIGSSIARLARRRGDIAGEIVATARTERTRATVERLGLADRVLADPGATVEGADCVILCTPSAPMPTSPPRSRRIWRRMRS